jgi:4-diphosphocytidyl-2-C-methyl-D-erythritol kinase
VTARVRVRALAKLNLSLKVLHKRADGYHELRTIFQTVSLADRLAIECRRARRTRVTVLSSPPIPDNLIHRAALLLLDEMRVTADVTMSLDKRIPMGSGLGGGSSDAAAVLLALPALLGRTVPLERLIPLAAQLGSDVPFFLLGGTAIGLGRGTELYPIAPPAARRALIVAPHVRVSTAEAYAALGRGQASELDSGAFQAAAWQSELLAENDFEAAAFARHPELAVIRRKLSRLGARPGLLTGSGSALFGLFETRDQLERARAAFAGKSTFAVSLVTQARYRAMWWRMLGSCAQPGLWPPMAARPRST